MAKDVLIQKANGDDTSVRSLQVWGIVATDLPFKIVGEIKDIPKNDWFDEDGDDEFIPDTPVYKAYEMEAKFFMEAPTMKALMDNIRNFITFIATNGCFSMYNPNTGVGRQNIRYVSHSDEAKYNKVNTSVGIKYTSEFSLKLKVNNPNTNITLNV